MGTGGRGAALARLELSILSRLENEVPPTSHDRGIKSCVERES